MAIIFVGQHMVIGNADDICKIYPEAEDKARAYLLGLEDKGKGL